MTGLILSYKYLNLTEVSEWLLVSWCLLALLSLGLDGDVKVYQYLLFRLLLLLFYTRTYAALLKYNK